MYDNSDQAFFVLLGDACHELTGRKTSELVESYFEVITDLPVFYLKLYSYKIVRNV